MVWDEQRKYLQIDLRSKTLMLSHALEDLEKLWSPTGSGQGLLESRLFRCLRDGQPQLTRGLHADEEAKAARRWLKQTKTNKT